MPTAIREIRSSLGLTQQAFSQWLDVPLSSLRMWDSGMRATPTQILARARTTIERLEYEEELLPFRLLAREFGIHFQTLQRAVRDGRLKATFSTRSAFGRPIYYDVQLRALRRRLELSQAQLAVRIGAARKAVIYQWESRKRTPSPVFWQRVQRLSDSTTAAETKAAQG